MNTATPLSPPTVTDTQVQWFGASSRLVGGQPDARYGWWDAPRGPCIVKAVNVHAMVYGASLLNNERRALGELNRQGAPVPEQILTNQTDWLVTRFAGISLRQLEVLPQPERCFPFEERLAAWVHFLRRAQALEASNALPIDLYGANLVLPLTDTRQGQLRLNEVCSIDHAHTVVAGLNMRRPVWLDVRMKRVPPELADSLLLDQKILVAWFNQHGAPVPGAAAASPVKASLAQRLWAEYDHPQTTQSLLDRGKLLPGKAIQYSVAVELARLQPLAPAAMQAALAAVQQRMQDRDPAKRFDTLAQASEQLARLLPSLPVIGQHQFEDWGPDKLSAAHAQDNPVQSSKSRAVAVPRDEPNDKIPEGKTAQTAPWRNLAARSARPAGTTPKPLRRARFNVTHATLALGAVLGVVLAYLSRN